MRTVLNLFCLMGCGVIAVALATGIGSPAARGIARSATAVLEGVDPASLIIGLAIGIALGRMTAALSNLPRRILTSLVLGRGTFRMVAYAAVLAAVLYFS